MGYSLLGLYKYCKLDEWAFANLINGTLFFNLFSKMNDPNEALVHRRWNQKVLRDESVLLCSLTEDRLNPIMWERYADHFKGLCIGYDIPVQETDQYLFNNDGEVGMYFRKVKYFEADDLMKRPLNNTEDSAAALDVFSEKTNDWEGESEFRSLVFTNDSNAMRFPHARPVCIDKRYLKSITFGPETPSALSTAVHSYVTSLYPPGVAFSSARFVDPAIQLSPFA